MKNNPLAYAGLNLTKYVIPLLSSLLASNIFAQQQTFSLKDAGLEIGFLLEQPQETKELEEKKLISASALKTLPLPSRPYRLALSYNSQFISISTKNGRLIIYNLKTGGFVLNKEVSHSPLYGLDAHPFKNKTAFADKDGLIGIFDIENKLLEKTIYELNLPISDIFYTAEAAIIAAAHFEGLVTFYEPQTKELHYKTVFHPADIYSLAADSRFSNIAAGSRDKTVTIFSWEKKKTILTLKDHKALVLACRFSPDDKFLATAGADRQIILYEKTGGALNKTPYFIWIATDRVTSLRFLGNYLFASSKDGRIRIFDYVKKSLYRVIDTGKPIIAIDVNNDYLCTASAQEFKVYKSKEIIE